LGGHHEGELADHDPASDRGPDRRPDHRDPHRQAPQGHSREHQSAGPAPGGSPTNNVDNLDADHDGQACEDFDYGATGGGGTGGGTGGDDGELPFTGPNDTLLPAGTALLVAGLALVGVTRYRARHARR
jgi:hypothetical protein